MKDQNGAIKYTLNCKKIGSLNRRFSIPAGYNNQGFLCLESMGPTLKHMLKKQNRNKFEERIINNTCYSAPHKENRCRPNFILNKKQYKDYRNTFCKLVFILFVGLYAADYFFMEQKLFNSIKPQANLIIAAVLTVVIVYALFQLLKSPQDPLHSVINGAVHENLMQSHVR